jgi:hypothetical protein
VIVLTKRKIGSEINEASAHFPFLKFKWPFVFNLEVADDICGASSQVSWEQKSALNWSSVLRG